jgi:2-polyprenyl-3-methyl-5-hydroxy-6-metoxy-1,4-benzoquinol methylase
MSYATIDDLRSQLGGASQQAKSDYDAKMMHPLPPATSVDRTVFLLKHVAGKRVLEFGASGPMHDAIVKAAEQVMGVDREDGPGVVGFDLDDVSQQSLPKEVFRGLDVVIKPDIIICGEVLEHLSNPGWFLTRLKREFEGVPVIITVPNAFAAAAAKWIAKGIENVNQDHVAWYSPKTLSVLLQRAGYAVGGLFWYGGNGPTAEGLIVVTE